MGKQLVLLALAGACGTLARFSLASWVQRASGLTFPWGTWAVNGLGCFLFGLIWVWAEERDLFSGETRFILLTGFLGAFTTFSTLAFETVIYLRESAWLSAAFNLLGQNLLGIACVGLGIWAARG